MVEHALSPLLQDTLNIVSWNILLDKTRTPQGIVKPQHERIEAQAKTLMELGKSLDVVVLQEVEGKNGQSIASMTGNQSGVWDQHNRKNEHIGVFGQMVETADFYDLGHGRKAVLTHVGGLAVFGVHLSARPKRYFQRAEESRRLCELIDSEEEAVVVGDMNGPRWEAARRMLARRGFTSAFSAAGLKRPITYPTDEYRDIMWTPWQQRLTGGGVSIDEIAVRGVQVREGDAHTFVGESDHVGLCVGIEV